MSGNLQSGEVVEGRNTGPSEEKQRQRQEGCNAFGIMVMTPASLADRVCRSYSGVDLGAWVCVTPGSEEVPRLGGSMVRWT